MDPPLVAENDGDDNNPILTHIRSNPSGRDWTKKKDAILLQYKQNGCVTGLSNVKGKHNLIYPSPHVLNSSGFGRPSLNHWFTQEGAFDHAVFFLLKNNWIQGKDYNGLFEMDTEFIGLRDLISHSASVDFYPLRDIRHGYDSQKEIPESRIEQFTAALIH